MLRTESSAKTTSEAVPVLEQAAEVVRLATLRQMIEQLRGAMFRARVGRRIETPTVLQFEAVECGAAALGIILRYYGRIVPLEELRMACGVSRDGSNALNILKAARSYGLDGRGMRRPGIGALNTLPLPVILYWNFNHFVVFEGMDSRRAYINDPATGPRSISLEELRRAFTGVALVFEPTPQFAPGGETFSLVRALRSRLDGRQQALFALILVSVFLLLPGFALPFLLRVFVDDILLDRRDLLSALLLGMGAALAARAALTWLQAALLLRLETRLAVDGAAAFMRHVLHLPVTFFTQRYAGDIAHRVGLNDRIAHLLTGELATSVLNLVLVVFYGLLMLQYDVGLTAISVVFLMLNMLVLRALARLRADSARQLAQERGKLAGAVMDGLRAIETIKAGGGEMHAFGRWAGLHAAVINTEQQLGAVTYALSVVPVFLMALNAALVLIFGTGRVLDGQLTPGALVAFQSLMFAFTQPVNDLVALGGRLQEAQGDLARLDDVLQSPAQTPTTWTRLLSTGEQVRSVELRGVTFSYSPLEPPLIADFNLRLEPGRRVALVGATGSGKSTVARLIAGLYAPQGGEITFDGLPRDAIPQDVMTVSLALVDQSVVLFSGTVRDNLTLWDERVPHDVLVRAAQDACLHERIMALPGGYDARLDEGGRNLSGGERQRLDLARALVTNPSILILDEATSALDPATEAQVYERLKARGCACLIIAHRLSAVRDCDEIVILDAGRIVERGTNDELLTADGVYAAMLRAQDSPQDAATWTPDSASDPQRKSITRVELIDDSSVAPQVGLVAAVNELARWLNEPLPPISAQQSASRPEAMIEELAKLARLRTRRVALIGDGWRSGDEPLLAFRAGQPVALLPERGGYTFAHDGQPVGLDADSAELFDTEAFAFYAPLPERVTGGRGLLRFGLRVVRRDVGVLLLAALAGSALGLAAPLVTGALFGTVIPQGLRGQVWLLGAALVGAVVASAAVNVVTSLTVLRVEGRADRVLQAAVWDRLLNLPAAFFRRFTAGDLAERAMAIARIKLILSDSLTVAVIAVLFSLASLALLFALDAALALLAVTLFALATAILLLIGRRQLRHQREAAPLHGETSGLVLQLIAGVAKLRVGGAADRALSVWRAYFRREREAIIAARRAQNLATTFIAIYPILAAILLFPAAVARGTLAAGEFLAFYAAFLQLLYSALHLSRAVIGALDAVPVYERLQPVLTAAPEIGTHKATPSTLSGDIELKNVTFRYAPDMPVALENVSLHVHPGEFVGIVGTSGSGKSTLVRLLLGFEQPDAGAILLDGQPLSGLDAQAVRRQMGVVLQNGQLSSGTILDTILGASGGTLADAWRAAEMAGIAALIRSLPMGMHTHVNEEGTTFSGGQRQQLLIARALVTQPRIILLDEGTSALDEQAQAHVAASLRALNATRIVVAHRRSTLASADRIKVIEGGKVVSTEYGDELTY